MIPAVLEKAFWVTTLVILFARGGLTQPDLWFGILPHGSLGVLFAFAYWRTPNELEVAA